MITERTLKRWRRDSLKDMRTLLSLPGTDTINCKLANDLNKRILILTQELLDRYLIEKDN